MDPSWKLARSAVLLKKMLDLEQPAITVKVSTSFVTVTISCTVTVVTFVTIASVVSIVSVVTITIFRWWTFCFLKELQRCLSAS